MTDSLRRRMLQKKHAPCRAEVLFVTFLPSPDPAKPTANGTNRPSAGADRDPSYLGALSTATLTYSELVSWLMAKEIGEFDTSLPQTVEEFRLVSAAAERVCQQLFRPLSRLVSAAGSEAMLSRALHLARVEFPFLEGVRAGQGPPACLEGLSERLRLVDADEAGRAMVAVVRILLDLLAVFIGEELTLRLVREGWPDLPIHEPSRPVHSDSQEATS